MARPVGLVKYGTGKRGRSRWLTIGAHGSAWTDENGEPCTLTADRARSKTLRLLGERARGNDPAAKRVHDRKLPTLREFSERYIEEHAKPHKKPRSVAEDEANLKKRILPALVVSGSIG